MLGIAFGPRRMTSALSADLNFQTVVESVGDVEDVDVEVPFWRLCGRVRRMEKRRC